MRTRVLIIGLAMTAATLVGCSSSGGGAGGTLDGVTWQLTSYGSGDGESSLVPEGVSVDATFDTTTSTVSGSGGCNRYTGSFTASGSALTFGTMGVTQMACIGAASEVEAAYLANLAAARTYTATADALTIFDESGAAILEYDVAEPGELIGVTWRATGINNGAGGVSSVVAGTAPTAIFEPAGTMSGNATCNQYTGAAVVDGTSIAIGPLASTKMACADEAASAQETAFLAALEAATVINLQGSKLELRDAGGALQVSFETP